MVGDARASYAVAAFYGRYEIQILRFFRTHALSAEDAEDVLQVTFVTIIEKAHALKEVSNGRAWIWQIARNTLLDSLRQRKFLAHH
jgi:RNA polymerase sigma-70 factor (ECF subfamily)